jgi:hypothetical protein
VQETIAVLVGRSGTGAAQGLATECSGLRLAFKTSFPGLLIPRKGTVGRISEVALGKSSRAAMQGELEDTEVDAAVPAGREEVALAIPRREGGSVLRGKCPAPVARGERIVRRTRA